MSTQDLNEREFELVNIIGARLGSNQRDLSRQMELSLGMVNMLVRRLIAKGYIRINQLNKRKVEYFLTPKGFTEKMRKSVKYTLKTISSIGLIKNKLKEPLSQLVQKGERNFFILGESDFSILVEMVLRELCGNNFNISHLTELPKERVNGTLLICREEYVLPHNPNKEQSLNLVELLAKDYAVVQANGGH